MTEVGSYSEELPSKSVINQALKQDDNDEDFTFSLPARKMNIQSH